MTTELPTCNGCMRYNRNGNNLGNCIEKKPTIYLNDKVVYRYCPCMICIVKVMCTKLCNTFFNYECSPNINCSISSQGG
jgi:hypothetical protein